jgi:hypothetical protein
MRARAAAARPSVVDLQAAINRFLEEHNQQSRPFVEAADPDKIIAAVAEVIRMPHGRRGAERCAAERGPCLGDQFLEDAFPGKSRFS